VTPTFSTFRTEFHTRVSRHIRLIAVEQELSIEHRQKNNLGTLELQMFYDQIKLENRGLDNLKQHYVAWVLAFITGASTCACYKEEIKRFSASPLLRYSLQRQRITRGVAFSIIVGSCTTYRCICLCCYTHCSRLNGEFPKRCSAFSASA
jgi:hypothetical protein